MPHLCCANYVQGPVTQPTPGVESRPAFERGAISGRYRSPDSGSTVTTQQLGEDQSSPAVYIRPPGVPKPIKNPFAYLVRLVRPYDGQAQVNVSTGAHQDLGDPVASSPQGEQRPPREGTMRGNTFRARPQPWDAANFVTGEG